MYGAELGAAIFATETIIVFAIMVRFSARARHMNKEDGQQHDAEDAIRKLNADLEKRLDDRTQSLALLTERLSLATSTGKVGVWDWDIVTNAVILR